MHIIACEKTTDVDPLQRKNNNKLPKKKKRGEVIAAPKALASPKAGQTTYPSMHLADKLGGDASTPSAADSDHPF